MGARVVYNSPHSVRQGQWIFSEESTRVSPSESDMNCSVFCAFLVLMSSTLAQRIPQPWSPPGQFNLLNRCIIQCYNRTYFTPALLLANSHSKSWIASTTIGLYTKRLPSWSRIGQLLESMQAPAHMRRPSQPTSGRYVLCPSLPRSVRLSNWKVRQRKRMRRSGQLRNQMNFSWQRLFFSTDPFNCSNEA